MPKPFKPKRHSTTTTSSPSSSSRNPTHSTTRITKPPRNPKPHHLNTKHTTDLLTSHIDQLLFASSMNSPSILAPRPQNPVNPLSNLTNIFQTTLEEELHVKRLEEEVLVGMGGMGGFSTGPGSGSGAGTGIATSAGTGTGLSGTGSGSMHNSISSNIKWKKDDAQDDGVE